MRPAEQFTDFFRPRRYAEKLTGFSALACPDPANRLNAMNLDVNTLFLVTIYVEAILGLLLLFAWVQNTAIYAVAWWGFAHLLRAASVMLFGMYGSVPDLISIDLANALLFTAFAVTWTGARVFDHRKPNWILLFAGAALWLALCRLPAVRSSWDLRMLLSSGIITAYTWATAYEFWRGRSEPLVSRWPAIFMLFAHGALYLLRTPFGAMLAPVNNQVFDSVWLTVLSFEALLFTISIAFILLAMAKERTEHRHKTASLVDPLTGIANRRAFLQDAEAQLKRQATDPRPIAVMLLDLDNFKVDQRPLRPCHRRPRAADVCRSRLRLHAPLRSFRPARRRGIRGASGRHHARAGARRRRADPRVLRRSDRHGRGQAGGRHREHRRRHQL